METGIERLPWRRRRPGTTGLVLLAFIGVLLLWIQVRPDDTVITPATTRPGVSIIVTDTVPTSTR